jgi:Putative prokaryotic signal transducing protein
MRLAYRAASLPDAQLIADLLDATGIEVRIFNQNAQSAAGEIPPAVANPQVWVVEDHQLERARQLVAEFQARPVPGNRHCPRCGEENPTNFLSCWACGGAL